MTRLEIQSKKSLWKTGLLSKLILLSILLSIVIAYTFSTDFFPDKSVEYIEYKKNYKQIIKKRDLAIQNAIKGSSIERKILDIKASSNLELQNFSKEFKIIKQNDSFFGYSSFKHFLLGTSQSLLSFAIALFFLFIIVKYVQGEFIKKFYLITSFVFVVTSGYWLAWSLLYFSLDPKRGFDFPKSWYYVAIYVLPTLVFVASYYLFKYNSTIEVKLKSGIKLLIDYISIDLFDKRIKEKDKNEVFIENIEKYEELTKIIK